MSRLQRGTSNTGVPYFTNDLELGGFNNKSGSLKVKDETGNTIVALDKSGILVNLGNYKIIQDGIQCNILPLQNLIGDHSFENINPIDGFSTYGTWSKESGSPTLYSQHNSGEVVPIMFGYQFAVVTSANKVKNFIWLNPNGTYTVSGHVASFVSGLTARMTIRYKYLDMSDDITRRTENYDFEIDENTLKRVAQTITLNSNENCIELILGSTDTKQANWDGIQVVEGDLPCLYNPDVSTKYFVTF